MKVRHDYLLSPRHNAFVAGLMLTSSAGGWDKIVVSGLGAGLLPMCMRNFLPSVKIEAVELDEKICEIARTCFRFKEDASLKVHVKNGVEFFKEKEGSKFSCIMVDEYHGKFRYLQDKEWLDTLPSGTYDYRHNKLVSPAAVLIRESFILSAANSLADGGVLSIALSTGLEDAKTRLYTN